jgi:hypothetical protein
MSCGNRFQCGLRKASRFSFQPDKPSNPELYNENQKRLNELLKAREDIDKQFFSSNQNEINHTAINSKIKDSSTSTTPWTTPSATYN